MNTPRSLPDLFSSGLPHRNLRFVFPSAVAADAWARWCVERGPLRAVDRERFVAWDRFKALTLAVELPDARPADGAARNIFCASFLAENAEAAARKSPLLSELVAPEYASSWGAFVASLSRTLPVLDGFFRRQEALLRSADQEPRPVGAPDPDGPYYADLRLLRDRYADFLDKNGLFEPAWNRVPFRSTGDRWTVIHPELVDDWDEYEAELREIPEISLFGVADTLPPALPPPEVSAVLGEAAGKLVRFGSAQEELRWVARVCCRLVDEAGLAPSDIAVSVPGIDDYAERLALEFRLRDLPLDARKGRPLTEYPAGRLFSALAACRSTRWSYRALKDLLLEGAYPWKARSRIDSLLDFGLRFRCVSGFPENGKEIDVWERSFERLKPLENQLHIQIDSIESFYKKLKRDIRAIVDAPTFDALRQKLLEFKSNQFDETGLSDDTNNLFSRALEELGKLAETEKRLSGVRVGDPYSLFLTHLRSVPYVFQADAPGIRVFDYRVAAGIAPVVHFVLNATQSAASVRSDPAPFLREDRKLRARVGERDLSADFIAAYALSGAAVVFTAPERGFSGYAVPHRALLDPRWDCGMGAVEAALGGLPDPYAAEAGAEDPAVLPARAVPTSVQAVGRAAAGRVARRGALDARRDPLGSDAVVAAVLAKLADESGTPRLSPTDLNALEACPYSWFLRRCLAVSEKDTEISGVDARELGILYHAILERLFARIAGEDARFRSERIGRYLELLEEEIEAAIVELRSREGAFQESVYEMYRTRISSALRSFLSASREELDGAAMVGAELPLRRDYPDYGFALTGISDLVLRTDAGPLALYDFKTGEPPRTADLLPDEEGSLADVQIAAYVRMLERDGAEQVERAAFYSIEKREYKRVIHPDGSARSALPVPRTEYDGALSALDESMEAAAGLIRGGSFPVPPPAGREVCASCRVSSVCRIPYAGGEA